MYKSLKSWMTIPAEIRPFAKRTGTGSKVLSDSIHILCYAAGEIAVIKDNTGADVVSSTQIYIDGNVPINVLDNVVFEDKEWPIKSINTFYRNGKPDIKVVYL